jgi:polysaccharide export outer membrane protein
MLLAAFSWKPPTLLWIGVLGLALLLVTGLNSLVLADPVNSSVIGTRPYYQGHVRTMEQKYLLSPGDHLDIQVFNAPEFTHADLTIRPDGYLTIHSVGELHVAGMDVSGLEQLLSEKLGRYLRTPEVSVTVRQFHPAIVYVLGAVQKPGALEIHGDLDKPNSPGAVLSRARLTVANLLAHAGGVTEDANLSAVHIRNNQTGETRTVDLMRLIREGDIEQDVLVSSGDTIEVPRMDRPGQMDDETYKALTSSSLAPGTLTVRVLGQVDSPGVYTLNVQNAGINSAIASAHGYLTESNARIVKVYRMQPDGQLSKVHVDPFKHDFVLRNNDMVYVQERGIPVAGRGLDYLHRTITPFFTFSGTVNSVLDIFNPSRRFPAAVFRGPN